MDTPTLIWIIIGIIVVAIIIVVVVMVSRRNSAKRLEAQHAKAEGIREDARRTEMAAREREADAAQARADSATAAAEAEQAKARAAQASIEAERAAATIDDHQADAEALRAEQAEKLRKADELDPAVTTASDRTPTDRTVADEPTAVEDRRIVRDNPDAADRDRDGVRDDRETVTDADGDVRTDTRPPSTGRV